LGPPAANGTMIRTVELFWADAFIDANPKAMHPISLAKRFMHFSCVYAAAAHLVG